MKLRSALLAATVLAAAPIAAKADTVTGLYIGAGAGVNLLQREPIKSATFPGGIPSSAVGTLPGSVRSQAGLATVLSIGGGFYGLRVELEGSFRDNKLKSNQGVGVRGDEQKFAAMVNAFYDFDFNLGLPIVPYVGAGVGYAWSKYQSSQFYGGSFSTDAAGNRVFGPGAAYSYRTNQGAGSLAYQGIAGFSFPINAVPGLAITTEYRYFGLAGDRSVNYQFLSNRPAPAGVSTRATIKYGNEANHSIMVGVRYAFNAAPPPPPAIVTPAPVAREAARTYLVFFDWDRADLTPRARQVVAEAAQATTRVQVTRIQVNGFTDTSGTPRYNQGLSVRRAQTVANELVRDGVPRSAISIQGFGETRLLVPTADGVREPQNRRVEIVLQ